MVWIFNGMFPNFCLWKTNACYRNRTKIAATAYPPGDVGRWLSARWSRQGYVPMDAVDFSLHKYFGMRNIAQQLVAAIVCK